MAMQDEIKKKPQPKPIEKDDFGQPVKRKNKSASSFFNKLLIFIATFVLIMSVTIVGTYFYQDYSNKKKYDNYSSLYSSIAKETGTSVTPVTPENDEPKPLLPLATELLAKNPDTVGWIKIDNTKISYPVVLNPTDTKNEYYLTHNFDKQEARAGAVFADYRTTITDRKQSDNIVLYSHNEINNTMFGDLDLYKLSGGKESWGEKALQFYKENCTFTFDTNYEKGTYKIFAIFVTETKQERDPDYPLFDYNNYIDFTEERYNQFFDNINLRNRIKTDIDCRYGDKFLTLSTCSNETTSARMVVIGRKVRNGESTSINTDAVEYNENAHSPDWSAIYSK